MTASSANDEEIFHAARAISDPERRQEYLRDACGGDESRFAQLEALLAIDKAPDSLLDRPPACAPTATIDHGARETSGSVVAGRYKLLELIGEGGMGEVWVAEQLEPIKRRVALKLIKLGMDSRAVLARFEAERQALALMDHPNIARVLDAGTTDDGRPFFVMELVKGTPITQFCDERKLTTRERLELFIPVCHAIQHAHQKGIIHRDVKPSNVLVALHDEKPVPKVIDFGVAKAVGQQLTEKTLYTGFGTLVGTPSYMAPEQATFNQLDIDTRADIYSLGVLLYELLAGSPPFEPERLKKAALDEVLRLVREEEPPRPSARLSTAETRASIAAVRRTEPGTLAKLLRGELDWVVMKALEKNRNRRYETANGFAMDVQRYLADEPVQACPPSAGYRLKKFARRNKGGLAVAALVLFFLVLLASGVGWAWRDRAAREAEAARQQSEQQAKIAGQVESVLAEVDRLEKEQKWPEALAAARRADAAVAGGEADALTVQRVRERLKDLEFIDRLEQIRMRRATWVEGRLDFAGAEPDYARAFHDYGVDVDALAVETSIDRLKGRPALAIPLALALDDWVVARRAISEKDVGAWKQLVAVARGIDPDPLRDWLRSTWVQPSSELHDELHRLTQSIDIRAQHPATLVRIARGLQRVKDSDASVRLLRDAQRVYPGDFWLNFELAAALREQKDHEGGVRFYTAAVSIRPNSAVAHNNFGNALRGQKKLDEAIAAFRKAIELDPKLAAPHDGLGALLCDELKDYDKAIECFHKAIELGPKRARTYRNLGNALRHQKKLPDAIAAYRTAIDLEPEFARAHNSLGCLLCDDLRDYENAAVCFRKAIELDPEEAFAHSNLGNVLVNQNRLDEAVESYKRAIELEPKFASAYRGLGNALRLQKKPDEAVACGKTAVELDPNDALAWLLLHAAVRELRDQKKWDEAITWIRKAIELRPPVVEAYRQLGLTLLIRKKPDETIAVYRQGLQRFPDDHWLHIQLAHLLWKAGRLDEAIAETREAVAQEKKKAAGSQLTPSQYSLAHLLSQRAWELVAGAEAKSRDPKQAIDLAQEAVALLPNSAAFRTILGAALYRAGNWKDAALALEKARQVFPDRKDSVTLFFQSMAHGRLNEKGPARTFFDQAVQWRMGNSTEEELRRLCAEAAALLGLEVPPALKEPPELTPGPTLVKPAAGATLDNGTRDGSRLFVWEFDWSDVPGATQYHLYVFEPTVSGTSVAIDDSTLTSSYFRREMKRYEISLGWRWKVRALVNGTWTDWSEERTFKVAPPGNSKSPSPKE